MKAIKSLSVVFILQLIACTKIIDINLNTTSSKIVIQAELDNYSSNNTFVKLTRTVNFSDSNVYPPISNAIVSISDNLGNTHVLTEMQNKLGYYTNESLLGVSGRTYTLKVEVDKQIFTAINKLQQSVELTNVVFYLEPRRDKEKTDSTFITGPNFNTAITNQNLFLIRQKINNLMDSVSFVRKSIYGIKNVSIQPLFETKLKGKKGDKIEIFFSALNNDVYEYFYVLNNGLRNETSPTNPTSNINGGAIGYFSAHATTYKILKIGSKGFDN